jgi:hypothetical protein
VLKAASRVMKQSRPFSRLNLRSDSHREEAGSDWRAPRKVWAVGRALGSEGNCITANCRLIAVSNRKVVFPVPRLAATVVCQMGEIRILKRKLRERLWPSIG